MGKFVGKYSYSVEVPLTNYTTQGQNKFNDLASNSLLNPAGKKDLVIAITGIECYYASIYGYSTSNRPVVTQANAAFLAVTFNVANDEPIYQVPYLDFATVLNYGEIREIQPMPINLQKSYVIVQNSLPDGTTSAIFNFWYMRLSTKEWEEMERSIKARELGMTRAGYEEFMKSFKK